jgi:hypothetical protein
MPENKKPLSILEKLKQKALDQKNYGGDYIEEQAKIETRTCANCGAGRSDVDGLTHCGYCGFEFISTSLSDGIHIKKSDNSKK